MTCPSWSDLVAGQSSEHLRTCEDCQALVEVATTRPASACGLVEALLSARATGALAADNEPILDAHLARCAGCRELARALETPVMADVLVDTSERAAEIEPLVVVAPEHYVRGVEIGRGGMGHIVRAYDRRLGRFVAIKQLLDPSLGARFEQEARLTARLQHPSIVTVYEAGRWPSGEPFYAMRYVIGRQLDQVIAELPALDRLGLLANLTTVVEAIAYAHSEGVVHRDLKPQNILIGAFGETVVIDWGLAKDLREPASEHEPSHAGAPAITVGGAGTPAYMAPEQARGEPPDERVDVYALGATLHHVLAGTTADRAPLPDNTPPDLRAIVARAMAEDRSERYPSAAELAGELRRFQNGQLVASHRYTVAQLARRWLRRHRAIVAVSSAAAVALVAIAIASVHRIVAERDRATEQERIADQQRRVAEVQRRGAEHLVDFMLNALPARLEPIGKLDLLAGVGKEVEGYFGSVPDSTALGPELLLQRAHALTILGEVDLKKGNFVDAEAEFARSRQLCARADAVAATAKSAACIANAVGQLAGVASFRAKSDTALAGFRTEGGLLDAALSRYPHDAELRRLGGRWHYFVGREYAKRGDYVQARAAFGDGIASYTELIAERPDNLLAVKELAAIHDDLCQVETEAGLPDAGLAHCQQVIALMEHARALEPENAEWQIRLGTAMTDTADTALAMGDTRLAKDTVTSAVTTLRRRVDADPANNAWTSFLASALWTSCMSDLETIDLAQAQRACVEAESRFEHLLQADPERMTAAVNLVGVEATLAIIAVRTRRFADARAASEKALEIAEAWSRKQPDAFELVITLCEAEYSTATVAHAEGHNDRARKASQAALDAVARIPAQDPTFQSELAVIHNELLIADLDGVAGDRESAIVRLRRILGRLEQDIARWPHVLELAERIASAEVRLAELVPSPSEARQLAGRALATLEPLIQRGALEFEYRDLERRAHAVAP